MSYLKSFPRVIWHQNQSKGPEKKRKETQTMGFCVFCLMYDLTQYVGIDETYFLSNMSRNVCPACPDMSCLDENKWENGLKTLRCSFFPPESCFFIVTPTTDWLPVAFLLMRFHQLLKLSNRSPIFLSQRNSATLV